ncbi:hypothetical protein PpBr36_06901, partial [Pyricularia pennisetigena]|uniref:hypothetical protein n=1 Tax=Pyricularia pennisetigena TaxID=1578925 RepID=UPI001154B2CE
STSIYSSAAWSMKPVTMANVSRLDFAQFSLGTKQEKEEFGRTLTKALIECGFVKLINHGIADEAVAHLLDQSRRLFYLPTPVLQKIACVPGPNPQRGWCGQGTELVSKTRKENYAGHDDVSKLMDAREHFDAGPLDDSQFPNLWPDEDDVPGFQETIAKHYRACQKVARQLMAALEIGMGLSPGVLVDRCRQEASEISLNRYPQIATETLAEGRTKRIWPHTDYGVITLLFQGGVGGLELEDRTRPGEFLPVAPTPPGQKAEMVVNASDTFERWTNGVVRAGLHRVALPYDERRAVVPERYSCAFFQKASRETSAGPLPQFVTEENPARYDEITALQFQQRRNRLHY